MRRSIGLLDQKKPQALLIKTRFGIHTFGMRFPIDVLVLDTTNHVAIIKENLQPNRIFLWKPTHDTVIELPHGTIEKSNTVVGNKIEFQH
jgi:uncharacterized membrane protein (UPF0127 family)